MAICATCGNDYDKAFTVSWNGLTETFDSLECAAVRVAPECAACGCRILGHGVETSGIMYCCAHCARQSGHPTMVDRHSVMDA
ncbi:hypothetical protein [Mycobacterium aquaticum]|uniref:Prokaryotic metallothionein n=1 Tax=Mycobacterium aquaticum TaxID=1927124 RepID=A0A1X0ACV5_9MYCO|nr:hypothetical protein [Mycobacterium aquaticum]ORA27874.1 hypothetical protein BST13_29485 [Mycobacterium aquaticum]